MQKMQTCKRLLSLLLCAVLVLGMVPVSARAATMTGGEVLYLTPNGNWKADNARFAAYFFGSGDAWAGMTDEDGDGVYACTVPEGSWTNVIFCRMKPDATENKWENKWTQSGDLVYDGTNNHCVIPEGVWEFGTEVPWTVYTPSEDNDPAEPEVTTDLVVTTEVADGYTYADGVLTFTQGGDYTVALKSGISSTDDIIVVDAEGVSLTLDNVTINAPAGNDSQGERALTLQYAASLTLVGVNTLTGGKGDGHDLYEVYLGGDGGSGIDGDVTISGTGSLTVTGGNGDGGETNGNGGTGISGAVTLNSGSLIATGGQSGSGIYGGNGGNGISGAVTLSGGILTASGGTGGEGDEGNGTDGKALDSTIAAAEGCDLVIKAGADAASAAEVEAYNGEKYVCITAQAPAPPVEPDVAYCLFGFINGANYGCEEDHATVGDYCFLDGKLTATFDQTSYVAVKTTDNANWYMTDGWKGEVTSVTLYHTSELGTTSDKLMVPGGVELTFTLEENADGTLTLSYAEAGETPVEPELFDISYANMILGNSLTMNFAFEQAHREDWTGCYAEIVKSYADGETVEKTVAFEDWSTTFTRAGGSYYVSFNDIAAKEMTDAVYVTIYDAEGNAISNVYEDSVESYALRVLDKAESTDTLKTMIVDMLNYGAAAQEYFDYNTADLANGELTEAQQALATQTTAYEDGRVKGANYMGTRLILESNISMEFAFRNLNAEMTAEISYTDHYGDEITLETQPEAAGSSWIVTLEELVVADGRQAVTVKVYDGETVVAEVTDSMESYVARMNGTSSLFQQLMKFSDSAYNYFRETE